MTGSFRHYVRFSFQKSLQTVSYATGTMRVEFFILGQIIEQHQAELNLFTDCVKQILYTI